MNAAITIIVLGGLIGVFYFIACRARTFRRCLAQNGFEPGDHCPEHVEALCGGLFDGRVRPGVHYRARADSRWGDDAWVVDVDAGGGDDPSQQVLISGAISSPLPAFVLGLTEGITRFDRLNRLAGSFKKTGLRLLPESLQPFLQQHRGIAVYSRQALDAATVVPPAVVDGLRSGGYGGAAFFNRRVVVWTFAQARPEKLFRIAEALSTRIAMWRRSGKEK
ncbi:hypothetical protein DSCA_23540 [Desulfosarcina alkanivorans]|uniref:Uncharacterized protein n=1 Tax=Desulfosarcina alkanivorans TaxID=571177 RepID=A0A5K7YQ40_9BACT|nr:hypothetical protein [Desulfosarcina alkanivorans]BBO68424.1 hypothetical protein DSCA_23540 [Desulfosarcina alkanivorans]